MPEQFLHGIEYKEITDGIRPIRTIRGAVIGIVVTAPDRDAGVYPANTPTWISGPRQAAELGATGTAKDVYTQIYAYGVSRVIMVFVDEGLDAAATEANVIGDPVAQTGVHALTLAQAVLGVEPDLIGAPGFTMPADPATKNPVAVALDTVGTTLKAEFAAQGPVTGLADRTTYAELWSSRLIRLIANQMRIYDADDAAVVTQEAEASYLGAVAKRIIDKGFWWSVSNTRVMGAVAAAQPVAYIIDDGQTEGHLLSELGYATIVQDDGLRWLGNRTRATDPRDAFATTVRTRRMIGESIVEGHRWARDKPMSDQLVRDIVDSVQSYLDRLTGRGAILGGKVWVDPELNTDDSLDMGQLFIDVDWGDAAPLERLTFNIHDTNEYNSRLLGDVPLAS
ncbi:MAG TPA: phage tail protein [Roseovarius sp.]|nr:phage tail protein [Roseovarius sp.]